MTNAIPFRYFSMVDCMFVGLYAGQAYKDMGWQYVAFAIAFWFVIRLGAMFIDSYLAGKK